MKILLTFFLCLSLYVAQAQEQLNLHFAPMFFEEKITLDEDYVLDGQQVKITNLKFFISDLSFYKDEILVHTASKTVHLIDLQDVNTLLLTENKRVDFDEIKFNIGIDSLTNVSGAFEGDLDPTNGMYWTWQSGYINLKIEGISPICPTRHNKFQWHIGGYEPPLNTLRAVVLKIAPTNNNDIYIQFHLEKLFRLFDIAQVNQVMMPNLQATQIADAIPQVFTISK
jgi:hypothetical protein